MIQQQIDPFLLRDWDFSDVASSKDIHHIHPYPAKFIPQIPRQLLELFHPGDTSAVLDPFCGSGTTLVEAINAGLDAWGIDLNPLACLTTRVKTTPLPVQFFEIAKQVIKRAKEQLSKGAIHIPPIPRVDHWFKPHVQQALAVLVEQINMETCVPVREALQVALSSIIVQVSNQESDTRYAAIEKSIATEDVFVRFEKAALAVHKATLSLSDNLFTRPGRATVLNRDILTVTPDDLPSNIGLVITSPPYPNAYEYWLYHKYRMYWLGMDPLEVREHEIGARPHYFGTHPQDERDFARQMSYCFQLLARVMRPGAKACFLVGRSIIHGREIDNVDLLQQSAYPHGFITDGIIKRRIPASRKAFNPSHGKINQEHLIVFTLEVSK